MNAVAQVKEMHEVKPTRRLASAANPNELLNTYPTVSVSEAAQILSVSRGQVYAMAKSGTLMSLKIGTRIVIPTPQLRSMVSAPGGQGR